MRVLAAFVAGAIFCAVSIPCCAWAQVGFLPNPMSDDATADLLIGWEGKPPASQNRGPLTFVSAVVAQASPAEESVLGDHEPRAQAESPSAAAAGESDLASDFTNPTKLLTSFQFNTWYHPSFYGATGSGTEFLVRPVIPVPKSTLCPVDQIMRIGLPVESMPHLQNGMDLPDGFMDVQIFDLFIFPLSEDLTLAAGPVAFLPTATSPVTGQGRWQLGPAFAGVYTGIPKWQLGLLLQDPISMGYSERESVSQLLFNPILTRHFARGWYASFMGATGTYDWRACEWTLPISASLGRVFPVGKQPVNFSVTPAYYANGAALTPRFEIEFNFALIYH